MELANATLRRYKLEKESVKKGIFSQSFNTQVPTLMELVNETFKKIRFRESSVGRSLSTLIRASALLPCKDFLGAGYAGLFV